MESLENIGKISEKEVEKSQEKNSMLVQKSFMSVRKSSIWREAEKVEKKLWKKFEKKNWKKVRAKLEKNVGKIGEKKVEKKV